MPTIDFHNHFYPPEYLDALREGPSNVRITTDSEGNPCLHYPGDYNVAVRGHRDITHRVDVLAQAGIDTQVLTLTTPGTHIEEPNRAIELARLVNDAFAAIVRDHGPRFRALATLPLNDPAASTKELERAMNELHLPGAMLFSNVNGCSLGDERYWPLYELANDRRAVLYIHPTNPLGVEAMKEYWLMPLVGFPLDTTLAAAHLVFAGIAKRFPGIRWVLGHLGGAIPYIAERLDRGFEAFADCRRHIDRPPSDYLRRFYYDTVNFDPRALQLAINFAGIDHILTGSDYPHLIGSLEKMLVSIERLELTAVDQAKILGQNAQELLGGRSR
jgi:aminocarboxymuconate-semialdehyde decarboxylase